MLVETALAQMLDSHILVVAVVEQERLVEMEPMVRQEEQAE